MSKGITAFFIVVALTLSIPITAGLGVYDDLHVDYSNSANDDVQEAADALIGQEATDESAGSALEDFTTSAATSLSAGWQVLSNLSGILQLLFGLPAVLTDPMQTFFQVTFGITFIAFIRGVMLQ